MWRGAHARASRPCATRCRWSGSCCSAVGMFALFLDLEHKLYVWRLYTDVPADLADVVGRVDPARSCIPCCSSARCGEARRAALARVGASARLRPGGPLRRPASLRSVGAREHRPRRRARHLHGHPPQSTPRGAAAVEQRHARPAVPALGIVRRPRPSSHLIARDVDERALLARADNPCSSTVELARARAVRSSAWPTSTRGPCGGRGLLLGGPLHGRVLGRCVVGLGHRAAAHRPVAGGRTVTIQHAPIAPLLVMAGGLALRFVFV